LTALPVRVGRYQVVVDSDSCCTGVDRTHGGVRDRGVSMIEILISIVLLGMAVSAMLTTLKVSISASATERDHANAHAWLQTASDVLYGLERLDCGTDDAPALEQAVRTFYETEIKNVATNPEGWPAQNIEVVPPVLFWDGEVYQNVCYDDDTINLQLITIRVRDLNNKIVETVQVVKG
jgi:prepilin-type N-terminal cleavage/methylation domain-containing protein